MTEGAFIGAPPSELSAFRAERVAAPRGKPPSAAFDIRCADCGGGAFKVFEQTLGDGEQLTPVGLVLVCAGCQHRRELFDMRRHGYDGQLDHWKTLAGVAAERPLSANGRALSASPLRTRYLYNIPPDELLEVAGEEGQPPQDFYDAFGLEARQGDRWVTVWDCECA